MSGPMEQYHALQASSSFLFIVFYRGSWCPFCIQYLKTLASINESIKAAGGNAVIVTSQAVDQLQTTRTKSGYHGEAIVDPENLLASELKREGLLDVAISDKGGYPHGMAQPAVLVMTRDGKVLYNWASVPSLGNIGGAKDRPSLTEIWADIKAGLDGQQPVHHGRYSKQTFLMGIKTQIFG